MEIAQSSCRGRALFVLEGGYHPAVVREGVLASLAAMTGDALPIDRLGPAPAPQPDAATCSAPAKVLHGL